MNDYYVPGVGYYHAPFNGFYPNRYNSYDAVKKLYFFGGYWAASPYQSIINISSPTEASARWAEANRTDVIRGGFGGMGGGYSTWG